MADFDPELYLRLLGERALLDRSAQRHHRESPLQRPAAALVIAGAITAECAQRVIDDYDTAIRCRTGQHHHPRHPMRERRRHPGSLDQRDFRTLDHAVPSGDGTLTLDHLIVRSDTAQLHYHWQRDPAPARGPAGASTRRISMYGGGSGSGPLPWGAPVPRIADHTGQPFTVNAAGGSGSDEGWAGDLALHGRARATGDWLEIEGQRVPLGRPTALRSVTIEELPAEDPVTRHLWRQLAASDRRFGRTGGIEPGVAALLAAGVLRPSDPRLAELRTVAARLPDHPHLRMMGGPTTTGRGLAEPWRSLLSGRRRPDGPTLALTVGALTPVFDGLQIAVHALRSDAQQLEIEFAASPNVLGDAPLGELAVAWWARDDRGQHHLGGPSGWGGTPDHVSGTLVFWPALDPRARRLEIMPTADSHRAVIAIDLVDGGTA